MQHGLVEFTDAALDRAALNRTIVELTDAALPMTTASRASC